MELIFFHHLIKIHDNESKHATSNSQQHRRQDVNFYKHKHAYKERHYMELILQAYGWVHFLNEKIDMFGISRKRRKGGGKLHATKPLKPFSIFLSQKQTNKTDIYTQTHM